jgi:hypothetical protein
VPSSRETVTTFFYCNDISFIPVPIGFFAMFTRHWVLLYEFNCCSLFVSFKSKLSAFDDQLTSLFNAFFVVFQRSFPTTIVFSARVYICVFLASSRVSMDGSWYGYAV